MRKLILSLFLAAATLTHGQDISNVEAGLPRKDCLIMAYVHGQQLLEQYHAPFTNIICFRYLYNGMVTTSKGHAMLVFKIKPDGIVYAWDEVHGSLELATTGETIKEIKEELEISLSEWHHAKITITYSRWAK